MLSSTKKKRTEKKARRYQQSFVIFSSNDTASGAQAGPRVATGLGRDDNQHGHSHLFDLLVESQRSALSLSADWSDGSYSILVGDDDASIGPVAMSAHTSEPQHTHRFVKGGLFTDSRGGFGVADWSPSLEGAYSG